MGVASIIVLAGLALAVTFVGWRARHALRQRWDRPVIFTAGHVYLGTFAVVGLALVVAITTAMARHQRARDRDAQLKQAFALVVTKDRLEAVERELRGYSRFAARAAAPSREDLVRLSAAQLRACPDDPECFALLSRTFTSVIRVTQARTTPAPAPPSSSIPRPPQGVPGARGAAGPRGPAGPAGPRGPSGPAGRSGAPVNSAVVDGLDNRLAAVERGLGSLLRGLCAPAVARLLNLLRLCA